MFAARTGSLEAGVVLAGGRGGIGTRQTGAIVTCGDSITDGVQSAADANNGWADHRRDTKER